MFGQRELPNPRVGWSKQTPPRKQDLSYLTHMVSMSALAQQLRLQDQVRLLRLQDQVRLQDQAGKGHMRSRLTKAGTHSIPVFLFSGSNRSAINQAGIKLRPKGLLWVDGLNRCRGNL